MGLLIAIEGIDGAGKTTQVELLAQVMEAAGESFVASKEPTDGVWGRRIRESAQNGRMSLEDELRHFVEDRKEHIGHTIGPALERKDIVILDRYFYSTIAYQGARGSDREVLLEEMKSFAPVPDIVLLLDVDPALGLSRISNGRGETPNEFEKAEHLVAVRDVFHWLADTQPEVYTLDGSRSIKDVQSDIIETLVDGVFNKFKTKQYDCDCMYCSSKEEGDCRWFILQGFLRAFARAESRNQEGERHDNVCT